MRIDKHVIFEADEKSQVRYFKVYTKLPGIIACIILGASVLAGLASFFISCSTAAGTGASGFLIGIVGLLGSCIAGVVGAVVEFFLLRIALSYQILHIMYLQKLLGENMKPENVLEDVDPVDQFLQQHNQAPKY